MSSICRRLRYLAAVMTLAFFSQATFVSALAPPTPEQRAQMRREGTLAERVKAAYALGNHLTAPALVANAQRQLSRLCGVETAPPVLASLPPGERGMPTTGSVKVLALLIEFTGTPHIAADSTESFNAKLFGDGDAVRFPYESLRNYYERSSYGALHLGGSALGWYTTAYPRSAVPQTAAGRRNLIKEAIVSLDSQGHDFSQYDNDGDGVIDYFMVFWTGGHGDWASFWWAYQTSFNDGSFTVDGKRLGAYSWQWESSNYPSGSFQPQTVIHETGHALGLPDYYDYDDAVGPLGGVGGMDMMDGTYGDHNCFSKFLLGWVTPDVRFAGQTGVSLRPAALAPQALMLMPGNFYLGPFNEYYLVQNRLRTQNDVQLPANGLLVWHVDGRLDASGLRFAYDNSYTDHKLLRLMEADGLEEIELGGQADAGDFYTVGDNFGPATVPNSSLYAAGPTGLGVRNFGAAGDPMTFDVYDVFADTTPPSGTPQTPVPQTPSRPSDLVFSWNRGTEADPESGIGAYYLQVGTTPGGCDKYDGLLGNVFTATVHDGENGKTYYARVRAVNGRGLGGAYSGNSAGLTVTLPHLNGAAVERPDLEFSLGGDAAWVVQTAQAYTGGSAFQSAPGLPDKSTCSVYSTIQGPGNLSFWWKVSSEQDYDYLIFSVDGVDEFAICGEQDWAERTWPLSPGPHLVKWTYEKDDLVGEGQDRGWVDQVAVTPLAKKGDLDQSQFVDVADMVILAHALVGNVTPGTVPFYAAAATGDLNNSGALDAADLALFQALLSAELIALPQ